MWARLGREGTLTHSWKVGKLVVPMRVDRPWSTDVGETLEPGQGWPRRLTGVPRLCVLGHGEPLKVSEPKRVKITVCCRMINNKEEKLSGMEASTLSF